MIPRAIQGDERRVVNPAKGGQDSVFLQSFVDSIKNRKEGRGRDRIEHRPDLVVRGDLANCKEAGGVVLRAGQLHRFLMGEERGGLGEKDREGTQPKILHRVGAVLAFASIRQTGQDLAQATDQILEADSFHALSWRRKSTLKGWSRTSFSGPCGPCPGELRPRPVVRPTGIQPAAR